MLLLILEVLFVRPAIQQLLENRKVGHIEPVAAYALVPCRDIDWLGIVARVWDTHLRMLCWEYSL